MPKFQGGCLCGAVRYEVDGEPMRVAQCHCNDCRKALGASFATNVFVKEDEFTLLQGETSKFDHPADSGNTMTKEFCPKCGSQVWGGTSGRPGIKVLRVGSIDDASWVKPAVEVFVARALPFTRHNEDTQKFDEMPPPA